MAERRHRGLEFVPPQPISLAIAVVPPTADRASSRTYRALVARKRALLSAWSAAYEPPATCRNAVPSTLTETR
jgi:hypothetical protein